MALELLDRLCRANYDVGYVQNVFGNAIVHHQRVVTGGANVVGIIAHKGMPVPYNWLQDLKILIDGGVVGLLDNHGVRGV